MNYKIVSDTSYSVFMEKIGNFFAFFISSRYFGSLPKTEKKLNNHCINFFFFYNTVQETETCLSGVSNKNHTKKKHLRQLTVDHSNMILSSKTLRQL